MINTSYDTISNNQISLMFSSVSQPILDSLLDFPINVASESGSDDDNEPLLGAVGGKLPKDNPLSIHLSLEEYAKEEEDDEVLRNIWADIQKGKYRMPDKH